MEENPNAPNWIPDAPRMYEGYIDIREDTIGWMLFIRLKISLIAQMRYWCLRQNVNVSSGTVAYQNSQGRIITEKRDVYVLLTNQQDIGEFPVASAMTAGANVVPDKFERVAPHFENLTQDQFSYFAHPDTRDFSLHFLWPSNLPPMEYTFLWNHLRKQFLPVNKLFQEIRGAIFYYTEFMDHTYLDFSGNLDGKQASSLGMIRRFFPISILRNKIQCTRMCFIIRLFDYPGTNASTLGHIPFHLHIDLESKNQIFNFNQMRWRRQSRYLANFPRPNDFMSYMQCILFCRMQTIRLVGNEFPKPLSTQGPWYIKVIFMIISLFTIDLNDKTHDTLNDVFDLFEAVLIDDKCVTCFFKRIFDLRLLSVEADISKFKHLHFDSWPFIFQPTFGPYRSIRFSLGPLVAITCACSNASMPRIGGIEPPASVLKHGVLRYSKFELRLSDGPNNIQIKIPAIEADHVRELLIIIDYYLADIKKRILTGAAIPRKEFSSGDSLCLYLAKFPQTLSFATNLRNYLQTGYIRTPKLHLKLENSRNFSDVYEKLLLQLIQSE
jgi:hypothetical protein